MPVSLPCKPILWEKQVRAISAYLRPPTGVLAVPVARAVSLVAKIMAQPLVKLSDQQPRPRQPHQVQGPRDQPGCRPGHLKKETG